MKYRSVSIVGLLFFLFLLCGCASQTTREDRMTSWITRPLSELKQEMNRPDSYATKVGWKESTYQLANGNVVYIEPVSIDCSVHWEINQGGIIIGYQVKGCKQREDTNNIINTRISNK